MPRYLCVLGIAALTAAGCGRVDAEQERAALLEADRQWSQSTKDLDLFMSFWAPDATAYLPGMPAMRGADAIRKTWGEIISSPGFVGSWKADKADVSGSGDVGYTSGSYEMTVGGVKDSGKYVTVWKKQPEGTWKVAEDIGNSNLPPGGPPAEHVMVPPSAVKWGPAPPSLPPGAEIAVISGDPSQAQPFVIRGRMPAGYRVPLHWHPTPENITVLAGTVALGMGGDANMQDVAAGGFIVVPAEMQHVFVAKTAATIQVHGMGPFAVNYVNPADDPSKAAK
jgi:ketosteroid isomerase-like protein/quercetin dioxygenase-like cupin family protein